MLLPQHENCVESGAALTDLGAGASIPRTPEAPCLKESEQHSQGHEEEL